MTSRRMSRSGMGGWYIAGRAAARCGCPALRAVSCRPCCWSSGRARRRYDFGPGHPLTPRRFGPGIDLLRSVGAEPGLAPEPATDDGAASLPHAALPRGRQAVLGLAVRRGRARPGSARAATTRRSPACTRRARWSPAARSGRSRPSCAATSSTPSIRAAGSTTRCPARASGFCIYNDPALAIARARRDGLRVLYVDLDVHHGDGVQAIHWDDPGVLTLSFHESGRYLFPGTGGVGELGEGAAAGTVGQRAAGARDRARAPGWRRSGRSSPSWPPRSGRT